MATKEAPVEGEIIVGPPGTVMDVVDGEIVRIPVVGARIDGDWEEGETTDEYGTRWHVLSFRPRPRAEKPQLPEWGEKTGCD